MSDKRFALLIDSDNISAKYIDSILDEMTRHGADESGLLGGYAV